MSSQANLCAHANAQAFAGIVTVSVGHCHPKVKAAVDQQNARLQHTTPIYLNHQIAEYAKELTDRLPGDLKVSLDSACVCATVSRLASWGHHHRPRKASVRAVKLLPAVSAWYYGAQRLWR